ncbi:hypothetical protein POUND7_015395 [Theobroma cacao]
MSESEETSNSSSTSEKESPGSPLPPNDSTSDGDESTHSSSNSEDSGYYDSSTAAPPSPNSSNSSPSSDDDSNEQSLSPPSDTDSPDTSTPPSPPEKDSPLQSTLSPPSEESPPQSTSTSSSSQSPPSPSKQQSPPPSPHKQQSPPSLNSPSKESSQPSPEKSPPSSSSDHPPNSSPSPPPPFSRTSSKSPPPPNSTSIPSFAFSPPSLNGSTISSLPGNFSPQPLAPPPQSPLKTPSNAGGGSSYSRSSNDSQNKEAKNPHYEVAVGVAVAGVFIIAFVALVFFLRRRRKRRPRPYTDYMPPPANFSVATDVFIGHSSRVDATYYNSQLHGQQHSNLVNSFGSQRGQNYHGPDSGIIASSKTFFAYEELVEMTNEFSRQNIIGEGGFGCVYKGWLPDGRAVAVKQLKAGSGQGEREFRAEVEIISRVHHRHLVSLVGYCIAENQRLLIYDFVPNKTLEHHLHGNLRVLDWAKRVKIAVGAAKGLAYLHEDCHPKIIHRDIKSANILLEDDFEVQVADFGLAKLNDTTQTHVSTRVMGTFGYLAPEYASSGKLTDKSDVFSFGVVLLELITGRKPVDPTQPLGDESLVEWARPLLINALETGDFSELVDPRLEKHYVESEMFRMIEAAAACVRHSAAKRPRMVLVARALDFEGESDLSNGVKFGQSTVYDSGQYSQEIKKFRRMALGGDNSSEFDMYSGEYDSKKVSRGQQNYWQSRYSSGDFTSGESETQAFKPISGEYRGASGNYGGGRFSQR